MLRSSACFLVMFATAGLVAPKSADACEPPDARPTLSGIFPRTDAALSPELQVLVSVEGEGTPRVGFLDCSSGVCVPVEEPALDLVEVIKAPGLFKSLAIYTPDRTLPDGEHIAEAHGGGEPWIEGTALEIDASTTLAAFKGEFSFDYDVLTYEETNGGSCLGSVEGAIEFTIRPGRDADIAWYDVRLLADDTEIERLAIATGVEEADREGILSRVHNAPLLPDCIAITAHDIYGRAGDTITVCGARLCATALEPIADPEPFDGLGACDEPPVVEPPVEQDEVPTLDEPATPSDQADVFLDGSDSGCGCSTSDSPPTRLASGLLLLLGVLLLRRRL